ncbi:hypothetical protein SAMN02787081_01608 [Lysinibacillus fusiformis]|uniref:Uncharacterized protein n=1 Tax=Lysinibacillus fusiformis TaxID=28031 RepID=A0A1H9FFW1_9BACI|nr:hypothetical protein KQ41_14965 [Lysinibacillus fusiformis]QAS57878.1 hypothetical protein LSP_16845 [Lysinibacillus sphaericus]RDV34218.1 hypothetical protein C7B90_05525 [Lysinibacillus fusiformis]SCY21485.1 hypothetical protein SAMN02787081_01608 [Lysinibacillus fusiformis]SEN43871.1 hypothetical protein SAMN02787103_01878 [Lysinibacillus fusiformis]
MINRKAILIPLLILFITLLRQVSIHWGEKTTIFWFYLFGVIFLAIIFLYQLLLTRRKKER